MIRTYWWGNRRARGNFGDVLGPTLIEHLSGRPVQFAEIPQADIVSIGSILEHVWCVGGTWADYRGFVWGTARMEADGPLHFRYAKVLALRGRWTRQHTTFSPQPEPVLGDPGLLCHLLAPSKIVKKYQIGIIPHFSQLGAPIIQQLAALSSEIKIVDMTEPVLDVIATVASCQHVLSSALHGLILADSLGVPNLWLRFDLDTDARAGIPAEKYLDYYSVFGILEKTPIRLSPNETLESMLERFGPFDRPGLEQIQSDLLRSFPYRR